MFFFWLYAFRQHWLLEKKASCSIYSKAHLDFSLGSAISFFSTFAEASATKRSTQGSVIQPFAQQQTNATCARIGKNMGQKHSRCSKQKQERCNLTEKKPPRQVSTGSEIKTTPILQSVNMAFTV